MASEKPDGKIFQYFVIHAACQTGKTTLLPDLAGELNDSEAYYALMCIHYSGTRYPVELKLRHKAKTYEEGKKHLADYMDKLGRSEGWLVVSDRRKSVSWKKKLFWKTDASENMKIHIVGC